MDNHNLKKLINYNNIYHYLLIQSYNHQHLHNSQVLFENYSLICLLHYLLLFLFFLILLYKTYFYLYNLYISIVYRFHIRHQCHTEVFLHQCGNGALHRMRAYPAVRTDIHEYLRGKAYEMSRQQDSEAAPAPRENLFEGVVGVDRGTGGKIGQKCVAPPKVPHYHVKGGFVLLPADVLRLEYSPFPFRHDSKGGVARPVHFPQHSGLLQGPWMEKSLSACVVESEHKRLSPARIRVDKVLYSQCVHVKISGQI